MPHAAMLGTLWALENAVLLRTMMRTGFVSQDIEKGPPDTQSPERYSSGWRSFEHLCGCPKPTMS
jgi:hypothetical protein